MPDRIPSAVRNKWVDEASPEDRPHAVAANALEGRLEAVMYYLPLAADQAEESAEYVHQLRVWARRSRAAVHLFGDLLPPRKSAWLKKQLKRLRRSAGNARDCDVLIGRLAAERASPVTERWLAGLRAQRVEAQEKVVAVRAKLLRDDRLPRTIQKVVARTWRRGESAPTPSFGVWARVRMRPIVDSFFDAFPADPSDAAALHEYRIAAKLLRYDLELLVGAFPEGCRTEIYPTIEAVQDRLGDINDLATARARLEKRIQRADDPDDAAEWVRREASERRRLGEETRRFWEWFTVARRQELRDRLDAMLSDAVV